MLLIPDEKVKHFPFRFRGKNLLECVKDLPESSQANFLSLFSSFETELIDETFPSLSNNLIEMMKLSHKATYMVTVF